MCVGPRHPLVTPRLWNRSPGTGDVEVHEAGQQTQVLYMPYSIKCLLQQQRVIWHGLQRMSHVSANQYPVVYLLKVVL